MLHPSSSFRRKTANYDRSKTTGVSTISQSATSTPYHSSQSSSQTLAELVFSQSLDVRDGYNNIRIKEGDEHKAAFKTKYGLFEPLVMFFGLKNSPATFQNMMNHEYRDTIDYWNARGTAIRIYMDDIAIATSTNLEDHIKAVSAVFEVAERLDLYFKPEKCTFHAPRMDYLGVILEKGIMRMDPIKIAGIKNWPTPTKVKDIRSFLGFCVTIY
jgi:hypothetical protein